jgi:hypothetical protein
MTHETPSAYNVPRSWIHNAIAYAPGGPAAVADQSQIPLERLEAIMRGRPADDAEVTALARTLGVPRSLIFMPPTRAASRTVRQIILWTVAGLVTLLAVLAIVLFGLWRYAASHGVDILRPSTTTAAPTSPSKRTKPQAPILPKT